MNGIERNRTERRGPHPIVGVLREQGRSQSWLARRLGRTHEHVNRVLNGIHPAPTAFRAACAAALAMDVRDLFHDDSSASPSSGGTDRGSEFRAETAVGDEPYDPEEVRSIGIPA